MPNAVWTELLLATQSAVRALGLTHGSPPVALPPASVLARKVATDRGFTAPGQLPIIICALWGEPQLLGGDFEDTEVVYGILGLIVSVSNQDILVDNDDLWWQQQLLDMAVDFEHTIRPAVLTAEVTGCEIELNPPVDPTLFSANLDVGGISLRFRTNRTRNRGDS